MLADSPLACIRCARATFDWSSTFGRPNRSLTYSMRTSRTGRLLTLTALASLTSSRSRGWRRWVLEAIVGATADGLRTVGTIRPESGERAGAGRARRQPHSAKVHPPRGPRPGSRTLAQVDAFVCSQIAHATTTRTLSTPPLHADDRPSRSGSLRRSRRGGPRPRRICRLLGGSK